MKRVEGGCKLLETAAGCTAAALYLYLYRDTMAAAVYDKIYFVIPLPPVINLIVQFLCRIEDMRDASSLNCGLLNITTSVFLHKDIQNTQILTTKCSNLTH